MTVRFWVGHKVGLTRPPSPALFVLPASSLSVRAFLVELLVSQNNIDDAIEHSMALARNYEYLADFTRMRKVYQDTLRLAQRSKTGREWSMKILYEIADIESRDHAA